MFFVNLGFILLLINSYSIKWAAREKEQYEALKKKFEGTN